MEFPGRGLLLPSDFRLKVSRNCCLQSPQLSMLPLLESTWILTGFSLFHIDTGVSINSIEMEDKRET